MVKIDTPLNHKYLEKRIKKRNRRDFLFRWIPKVAIIGAGTWAVSNYIKEDNLTEEQLKERIGELEDKLRNVDSRFEKADNQYDFDTDLVTNWNQIIEIANASYKLEVKLTYTDLNEKDDDGKPKQYFRSGYGTGTLLEDGRVLTASHVLEIEEKEIWYDGVEAILTDVKYLLVTDDERYELEVDTINYDERDIGIAKGKTPLPDLPCFKGNIGDWQDLKRGNILYMVGGGAGGFPRIRDGIYSGEYNGQPTYSNGANRGDSGGSLYAMRDGQLEIIGVASAGISTGLGLADDLLIFEGLEGKL